MADTTAVKDAVNAEIKKHSSSYPKGAVLQTVTVHDRVAALDFSPEFSRLGNMGDSVESDAQKYIRRALAKFPVILKMTVTVNGKSYDSQVTDWTTPFPVRQTVEEIDASKEGAPAGPKESKGGGE
jgi:hypothetical protein